MSYHHNDNGNGGPSTGLKPPRPVRQIATVVADTRDLPPVFITDRDDRRLRTLLAENRNRIDGSVLRFLAQELDRAVSCPSDRVPADVVTMNARFSYRRDIGEKLETRRLVFDNSHSAVGATISILTPLGVAALGLREGSRMPYATRDGERLILSLERIAYQPEGDNDCTIVALHPRPSRPAPDDDDPGPNQAA